MKRKENGFAATGILYTILLIFLVLMSTLLVTLSSRTRILDKLKSDAKSESTEVKNVVYANGTAVYYNPETGLKCNESEAISKPGTKSGCMKWYIFNDDDKNETINIILDHNTTYRVYWNSTGSNSEMKEVKSTLENDTGTWKSDLNPRLIEANEIAKITKHLTFDATQTGQSFFYLDNNNQTLTANASNKSKYAWLFDYTKGCADYGCNNSLSSDTETEGYWTSTPSKDNPTRAWLVSKFGSLIDISVDYIYDGVRPVITIPKSVIKDGTGSEEKIELYEDGTKVGVTKNGKKCKIGTTDCYTGYTYGDTKGATKLNLVIGYDANVTGSKDMGVRDFYNVVGLSIPYCSNDFKTLGGDLTSRCILENVISEGYEWLYNFDYCGNENYLFRLAETFNYLRSGENYSVNTIYGWIVDKKQNKIASSTISEKVCNPGGCETTSGNIKACKIPKIVTVNKSKFI